MIIKFNKIKINTEEDRHAHQKAIEKHEAMHCSKKEPQQWWTYDLSDGNERFVHLNIKYKSVGSN